MRRERFLLACTLAATLPLHAAAQGCLSNSSAACNLRPMLQVLYVVAALLGLLLLGVIALAVHIWRKNRSADPQL